MIGRLNGLVVEIAVDHIIIDVSGVGYVVFCPARILRNLSKDFCCLVIETFVREDQIKLFGFSNSHERDWFRLLQTVQGVGPRLALAILDVLSIDDLCKSLNLQDHSSFERVSGVGSKVAMRIINELKNKIPSNLVVNNVSQQEALSALINLGYKNIEANSALRAVAQKFGDLNDISVIIRYALRELQ